MLPLQALRDFQIIYNGCSKSNSQSDSGGTSSNGTTSASSSNHAPKSERKRSVSPSKVCVSPSKVRHWAAINLNFRFQLREK